MSRFCADPICAARIIAFEEDNSDPLVRRPCPDCLEAMAEVLLHAQDDALARESGYTA